MNRLGMPAALALVALLGQSALLWAFHRRGYAGRTDWHRAEAMGAGWIRLHTEETPAWSRLAAALAEGRPRQAEIEATAREAAELARAVLAEYGALEALLRPPQLRRLQAVEARLVESRFPGAGTDAREIYVLCLSRLALRAQGTAGSLPPPEPHPARWHPVALFWGIARLAEDPVAGLESAQAAALLERMKSLNRLLERYHRLGEATARRLGSEVPPGGGAAPFPSPWELRRTAALLERWLAAPERDVGSRGGGLRKEGTSNRGRPVEHGAWSKPVGAGDGRPGQAAVAGDIPGPAARSLHLRLHDPGAARPGSDLDRLVLVDREDPRLLPTVVGAADHVHLERGRPFPISHATSWPMGCPFDRGEPPAHRDPGSGRGRAGARRRPASPGRIALFRSGLCRLLLRVPLGPGPPSG